MNNLPIPPIGILPYYLWREKVRQTPTPAQIFVRCMDVQFAIERFREVGLQLPPAWVSEVLDPAWYKR